MQARSFAEKAGFFMKKLCMALVAVLLWFAVVAGAASTLYFPDYVVGSGWSVQLALGNIDTTDAAEVVVEVYDQDGAPIHDLFESASAFEIPPLGSRVLRSTGEGSLRRGWIQVRNPSTTIRGLLTYRHARRPAKRRSGSARFSGSLGGEFAMSGCSRLQTGPLKRTAETAFETVIEVVLWWLNRKLARMP
ncbi:MAG: hypothetical protein OXB98_16355 [Bryobacterales bacterium]|nr:hypothetical protein [Bryobacterales bacterium]